ncbi:F-box/kelch-repeat protein At3g06240-like [Cornus florida]|uniref:F-box/kelch-repeat protein At3g06240-like n=1 Tax=Cornus florida TaxID=4283 RepID=UPI0028A243E4|nr:F-box/kelch-repeat protein At3g06240-like [Cornus florida]
MATKKRDDLLPILPYDLMMDILSRLSVECIVRFKCVSKPWRTMFADPQFVKLHLTRSTNFKLVFTSSFHSLDPMRSLFVLSCGDMVDAASAWDDGEVGGIHISDPQETVRISSSCRGLVLCDTCHGIYLVNPSTKEVIRLPYSPFSKTHYASRGLGYDASLDDYKVVQISPPSPNDGGEIITSLYSLKSNSWRKIQEFPYWIKFSHSGVFLNGNLHWFNYDRKKMVSFSLADEKYGDVPLPDVNNILETSLINPGLIGVVGGCLYFVSKTNWRGITFWVMKEYNVRESWTKFKFDIPCCSMKPLDFSNNDENLFALDGDKFVMCNLKERTHRHLEFDTTPHFWNETVTCLETLVSPKGYYIPM